MADRTQRGKLGKAKRRVRSVLSLVLAGSLALGPSACTRRFFRERADREVSAVLAEKDKYPAWPIEQAHVYPDPRARFADPSNPDCPPMPPDDPAAYDLSPHPQKPGKAGIAQVGGTGYLDLMAQWDAENRAEAEAAKARQKEGGANAEPVAKLGVPPEIVPASGPGAQLPPPEETPPGQGAGAAAAPTASTTTSLSTTPKPGAPRPFLLKLEQAVELGLINSREYQDIREDLYLTALPVTLERFSFAAQFFAAGEAIREWAGREAPGGHQNNWMLNSNAGFAKLFSTGALLLFNFANQTVFNFTGTGRPLVSQSTINLDLVQPFLRGGGRAVTLEPLTQVERNLVYEIRNFARFRKTFYVAIAGGGGGSITGAEFQPTNVIAPIGFSPTARLAGSAGLTPGIIRPVPVTGNPGLLVAPSTSGQITLATAFAAPVSGYLATLLQAAQMQVDIYNIEKLEYYLKLAKAIEEGGDISSLQVDQFEQQVLNRRTSLLNDQQQYLQSLDQFKLQLGLPTTLPIELDDAPFRPLNEQFRRYEDLFTQFVAASREPEGFNADLRSRLRGELRRIFTSSALVRGTRFGREIGDRWAAWERLSPDDLQKRQSTLREERRQLLTKKTDLEEKGQALGEADQARLDRLDNEIDLVELEVALRSYESRPWQNVADPMLRARREKLTYRYVISAFGHVLTQARNERLVTLRGSWPKLARLCVNNVDLLTADLDEAEAAVVQVALPNRLDLMNVRAQVVDAWRQLAVFANALLGTFNVRYHLDSSSPPGLAQPLDFSASRTRQQLVFDGQLPLVRVAERNAYRASLINYQRARRILQRAEDQVALDVRGELRQLRQQEENYRIQQRQVELGYLTVENSLDTFQAPAQPVLAGQQPPDTATRAAALTNQLIMAQSSLYTAQFAMTTIWITYLNTRLQLYRDMELMPLDNRGVWIDDVARCECPDRDAERPARLGDPQLSPVDLPPGQ